MKKNNKSIDLILNMIKNRKNILFFLVFLIFIFFITSNISQKFLITIPKKGGEINEIIINKKVRFINPVIALSPIDKDLVSLIYSPLLKINENGKIVDNIANYKLLEDKKTYQIILKDNIYFHDGVKLTADDIIFTIEKIQDPLIKSPYYGSWLGVDIKKINEKTVQIKLKSEYYQFVNNLVLYILPKHLWQNVAPEEFPFSNLNERPIGSGPFQIEDVIRNKTGEIEKYILSSFKKKYSKKPYLDKIIFNFFSNISEYQNSRIFKNTNLNKTFFSSSENLLNKVIKNGQKISMQTPKIFGIFIKASNNNEVLLNKKFRALFATIISGKEVEIKKLESLNGFKYSKTGNLMFNNKEIHINLTFFSDDNFKKTANSLQNKLKEYGIILDLQEIDSQNLLEDIIRDRKFSMILFGYNPGIISDLFYFFHSAQKNDPGANIAGIQNKDIDKILLELRKNISEKDRSIKEKKLNKMIEDSALFIPLYSSKEFYKIPQNLQNFNTKLINSRENRFDNIENWYLKEEKILPFLIKKF